jgi:hypothetical protein
MKHKKAKTDARPKLPERGFLKIDPEYETGGGWKVHLTIEPVSYQQKVATVEDWLEAIFKSKWRANFLWNADGVNVAKHLEGGEKHHKDFTIYLGSYATLMSFVRRFEDDPIVQQVDACKAGPADRIVGSTGKVGARFDPRGSRAGSQWVQGWNGVPFKPVEDTRKVFSKMESYAQVAERRKSLLRETFGDYFLPEHVE